MAFPASARLKAGDTAAPSPALSVIDLLAAIRVKILAFKGISCRPLKR